LPRQQDGRGIVTSAFSPFLSSDTGDASPICGIFISKLINYLGNHKHAYYLNLMPDTNPSNTFGALMIDGARLLRRRFDQRARAMGLTRAQWSVLSHLYRNDGINQAGLADLMEIEPITVGRQLDRMEEAGWISRQPDPSDRRVRRIYMTPKAQGVLDQMRGLSRDIYAEALDGIAPEAREQLMASLAQIRNNLSDRAEEASPKEVSAGN
jgi:MarR family transcriptional regulator for hemolysin